MLQEGDRVGLRYNSTITGVVERDRGHGYYDICWDSDGKTSELLGEALVRERTGRPAVGTVSDKKDDGKDRWELLPWEAVAGIVKVFTFGARKYTDDGWRQVPNGVERYKAALFRHAVAWASGEKDDPETGFHHLWHVACNAVILYEITKGDK